MRRVDLITNVEKIRKGLCCYIGDPCDCKYGAAAFDSPTTPFPQEYSGEATGCPELRNALAILLKMTDEEYNELQKRIYGQKT